MNLGKAIKELRKRKRLTQGGFCKLINIKQSYLSLIETGNRKPSIEVIERISNNLNIPLPILFWFTMTEEDIPEYKVNIFKLLKSAVDNLVYSFFNDETISVKKQSKQLNYGD